MPTPIPEAQALVVSSADLIGALWWVLTLVTGLLVALVVWVFLDFRQQIKHLANNVGDLRDRIEELKIKVVRTADSVDNLRQTFYEDRQR
jgi:myo-inositol catabolism protein IolC